MHGFPFVSEVFFFRESYECDQCWRSCCTLSDGKGNSNINNNIVPSLGYKQIHQSIIDTPTLLEFCSFRLFLPHKRTALCARDHMKPVVREIEVSHTCTGCKDESFNQMLDLTVVVSFQFHKYNVCVWASGPLLPINLAGDYSMGPSTIDRVDKPKVGT